MFNLILAIFLALFGTLAIFTVLQEKNASRIRETAWGWFAMIWYPLLVALTAKGWFYLWDYYNLPSFPGSEDQVMLSFIIFTFVALLFIYVFKIHLPQRRTKKQFNKWLKDTGL